MRTITIELSRESTKAALKQLNAYRKSLDDKLKEVCRRLAEIGMAEAQIHYNEANANVEEGNGNVSVSIAPTESGYKIVASGEDVYFIEFGTGNSAGMFYGDGMQNVSVPVYPGSYSKDHAQMYSTHGYWFYHGHIMSSTDSYMPMYWAGKAIRDNIEKVAREVFGE